MKKQPRIGDGIYLEPVGSHDTNPFRVDTKLQVIEIDLNKKYVLQYPAGLPYEQMERLQQIIRRWVEGDQPFLMIPDDIQLVKVSEDDGE